MVPVEIEMLSQEKGTLSTPLLTSIQRPTVSLGSASSCDKNESTFSSKEPSSTNRSISACNSISLSSHCQNGVLMRFKCEWILPFYNNSITLTQNTDAHQLIWWWCKCSSSIRPKHNQRLCRATAMLQRRHWDHISRCMGWGCRRSWTWRGSSSVCSSWTISRPWWWHRLLSLSTPLILWSLKIHKEILKWRKCKEEIWTYNSNV